MTSRTEEDQARELAEHFDDWLLKTISQCAAKECGGCIICKKDKKDKE